MKQDPFNREMQLTDALSKLDELYVIKLKGKIFNIKTGLNGLNPQLSLQCIMKSLGDDLINYMKTFI